MKTKTIPFDLETAKKIQAGEIEGKIISNNAVAEILAFDVYYSHQRLVVAKTKNNAGTYGVRLYTEFGKDIESDIFYDLRLKVPDNEPQFKPFDRVLVRNDMNSIWQPSIFSFNIGYSFYTVSSYPYEKENIIPFVGTTNNPK